MTGRTSLSEQLTLYLFAWCVFIVLYLANLGNYELYRIGWGPDQIGAQIAALFIIGALSLSLLHTLHKASEVVRWSLVIMCTGCILLLFAALPGLVAAYLLWLTADAWNAVGYTAVFLGLTVFWLYVLTSLRTQVLQWFTKRIFGRGG